MNIPSRDDPMWGPIPLPENIKEIRPQQWDIIQEAKEAFDSGDDVIFIEAPTGAGKSFIAEGLRRLLGVNAAYCCTTKTLQDQYAEAFPYGRVIKGRANYYTEMGKVNEFGVRWDKPWSAITCADCTWNSETKRCRWCSYRSQCPYQVARNTACQSELAILNTSYFLTETKYSGMFRGRGLVVMDEADLVEKEILHQISVEISSKRMDKMQLKPPEFKTKAVSWAKWIHYTALPAIDRHAYLSPKPWEPGVLPSQIREFNGLKDLYDRLKRIKEEIAMGNWIYDGYDDDGKVRFTPILIDRFGESQLWPTGKKFLLMSATILSADLMAEDLGLYLPYTSISVPSTFPVANRPIYVCPVADMSFKAKQASQGTTWERMVDGIRAVLRRHPNERVLVHAVNYELAQFLQERIEYHPDFGRRPIITYTESAGKKDALDRYMQHHNSVLLAASMDRGVDLPDDMCRVQIIAKVPFPNFKKDKRIAARMRIAGGSNWYASQAIKTLVQMSGRAIRHESDQAVTYILDQQFTDNLWTKEFLFPKWWKEALIWDLTPYHLLHTN